MSKVSQRFSTLRVTRLTAPGYHADGAGLYLRIAPGGAKGWIFRFTHGGRVRDMGFGAYPDISLAKARELAEDARVLVKAGVDPIERRKAERVAAAKTVTFDEAARQFIADHEAGWRNAKHRAQWTNTLKTYASPVFGKLPVSEIDSGLVLRALKPIWYTKPETASRVRGRIESVLDWTRAHGYRSGENPAQWKGNLRALLPAKSKVARVKHHPALPYAEIGVFMADLRQREGVAARALEFAILCACRTGDIIGNERDDKPPMKWPHVDLDARVWTILSTKTDTVHRVPLSDSAVKLLKDVQALGLGDNVFTGRSGEPLSNMAMASVIERINDDRKARGLPRYVDPKQGGRDVTVHGFRSTFRDWAAERTNYQNFVVEMALAHAISDDVEAAYRRSDLFDKRRRLMAEWARYCSTTAAGAKVVPIRRRV